MCRTFQRPQQGREQIGGYQGLGVVKKHKEAAWGTFAGGGEMGLFCILLTVVVVIWIYACVKTHRSAYKKEKKKLHPIGKNKTKATTLRYKKIKKDRVGFASPGPGAKRKY